MKTSKQVLRDQRYEENMNSIREHNWGITVEI